MTCLATEPLLPRQEGQPWRGCCCVLLLCVDVDVVVVFLILVLFLLLCCGCCGCFRHDIRQCVPRRLTAVSHRGLTQKVR